MCNPDIKHSKKLNRFLEFIGLDSRVLSGLVARVVTMIAGPVSSLIAVSTLTTERQGMYYLFGGILALRTLFELGVGTSVLQVSARARIGNSPSIDSPLDSAFVCSVNQWMARAALIFGIVVGVGGLLFLIYQGHNEIETISAWLGFLVMSTVLFSSEGKWALLEGADKVVMVNKLRVRNSLIQNFTQWSLLFLGFGLFSYVGGSIATFVAQEIEFRKHHKWLYASDQNQSLENVHSYKSELLRLIKKAGQTYFTSYFVFQIQQPICFHLLGDVSCARLGFTQSIGTALISLPGIWLGMNFPRLAHMVADHNIFEARKLFRSRWYQVIIFSSAAALLAWGCTEVLRQIPRFAERLMDKNAAAVLFGALAIQTVSLGLTYWPRAFRIEPFVKIAYIQMFATPLMFWLFLLHWGLLGGAFAILGSWIIGAIGISLIVAGYWRKSETEKVVYS